MVVVYTDGQTDRSFPLLFLLLLEIDTHTHTEREGKKKKQKSAFLHIAKKERKKRKVWD